MVLFLVQNVFNEEIQTEDEENRQKKGTLSQIVLSCKYTHREKKNEMIKAKQRERRKSREIIKTIFFLIY